MINAHSASTPLTRASGNPEDFPPLDGLRAIAASAVIIGHLVPIQALQKLVGWGDMGVVLFFCLSGFLITNILLRANDVSTTRSDVLKAFYARRFLRIFPIYYLTVVVAALVGYEPVRDHLLRLLTYTLNFPGLGLSNDLGAASHLWSLSVEEQFYLMWPVALLFAPRRYLKQALMIAVVVSLTYKAALALSGADYGSIFRPITGSVDSLALGALVAVRRSERPRQVQGAPFPGWLAAVVLFLFSSVTAYRMANPIDAFYTGELPFAVMQFFVITATSAVVIAHVVDVRSALAAALSHRALRAIARISYGLYLYHFFMPPLVAAVEERVGVSLTPLGQNVMVLIATFATATASWILIEAPLLRLKRRLPYGGRGLRSPVTLPAEPAKIEGAEPESIRI